jgi:hypothetical protein
MEMRYDFWLLYVKRAQSWEEAQKNQQKKPAKRGSRRGR